MSGENEYFDRYRQEIMMSRESKTNISFFPSRTEVTWALQDQTGVRLRLFPVAITKYLRWILYKDWRLIWGGLSFPILPWCWDRTDVRESHCFLQSGNQPTHWGYDPVTSQSLCLQLPLTPDFGNWVLSTGGHTRIIAGRCGLQEPTRQGQELPSAVTHGRNLRATD